jgi:hypothetical protein
MTQHQPTGQSLEQLRALKLPELKAVVHLAPGRPRRPRSPMRKLGWLDRLPSGQRLHNELENHQWKNGEIHYFYGNFQ